MRAALFLFVAAAGGAASAAPGASPAYDSAFAGYQAWREPVTRLAGCDTVAPPKPADPHAGHAMHRPAPAKAEDPHAGHAMHQPAPAAQPADPHAGHEHHRHRQQEE